MTDPLSALIAIAMARRLFGPPPPGGVAIGHSEVCVRALASVEGSTTSTTYGGMSGGVYHSTETASVTVDGVLFRGTFVRDATEAEAAEYEKEWRWKAKHAAALTRVTERET